jgi:hypothetical protein
MSIITTIQKWLTPKASAAEGVRIFPRNVNRPIKTLDIAALRSAISAARSGKWQPLAQLQSQIEVLDAHLNAVIFRRVESLTTYELYLRRGEDQIQVQALMPLAKAIQRALLYGRSVLQVIELSTTTCEVNVLPVDGVSQDKLSYETNKGPVPFGFHPHRLYLVDSGGLGVLTTAAIYSIYKLNGLGDYAQYAELYAMPVQDVTYQGNDPVVQQQIENVLKNQGSAAARIWPEGVQVNTTQAASSAAKDVYLGLIQYCDEQISKLVLGQTMTTDSGASYAQSITHQQQQEIVFAADRKFVAEKMRELLILHGVPCDEVVFQQVETVDVKATAEAMKAVSELITIDEDYLYQLFGVPKPKTPNP